MKNGVLSNFTRSHISSDRVRSGYEIRESNPGHSGQLGVACLWYHKARFSRWRATLPVIQIPAGKNAQIKARLIYNPIAESERLGANLATP